jgi:radical SAM PhpK family P-methyltransferase
MSITDCLILGFYEPAFPEYVDLVKLMGTTSGAYRDLALSYMNHNGEPRRALDMLTQVSNARRATPAKPFHNADFLWPVVMYLSSYLERQGFTADYVNLPHLEKDKLESKLRGGAIRTVVITTTLYVSPIPIIELATLVRKLNPSAKIIVGGPYMSNQAKVLTRLEMKGILSMIGADIYVFSSEGEATLAKVLAALTSGGALDFTPNLAFRKPDGKYVYTPESPESNSLAENMVDYSKFPEAEIGEFITTRTAKSCPFACSFCGFPARAGAYNYLSPADVEKELNAIAERSGVNTVTIIDDTFNVPKGRFKEIMRIMIRNQYPFKWNCLYRCDQGDAEAVDLMAEAGCEGVFLGVESGSDSMLERMNKTARRKHYMEFIPRLNRAGICTYASLIIGFPGETEETVKETIDLIETAEPEYYRAQLWYADPITAICKDRERYQLTGEGFGWEHATMNVQRACDIIDSIFLQPRNSAWLPQTGFEQWSLFYLQRRGMTRAQVRQFVEAFNDIVRYQLRHQRTPAPKDLMERLEDACEVGVPRERIIAAGASLV